MIETILTSSVLILFLTGLRYLLRGKINLRLQYALWALVALRLLLPFSLFESRASILNLLPADAARPALSQELPPPAGNVTAMPSAPVSAGGMPAVSSGAISGVSGAGTPAAKPHAGGLLFLVWATGAGLVGAALIVSNVQFYRRLKRTAERVAGAPCPLPVYRAEELPSPCLFGIFRPAVYLTPESFTPDERLRHILAHEYAHFRHGDHVWSFVRGLCVSLYWFNPLVWLAAVLSRRDCELACDEAALAALGEQCRIAYGRTLVGMMAARRSPADLLCGATTMTSGRGGRRERIALIARQPHMLAGTLACVLVTAALAVGCTFTGAKTDAPAPGLTANEALAALEKSIAYENGELSLTIPADYDAAEWNIHIAGRMEFDDGFSRSWHYEEDEGFSGTWTPGERYVIYSGDPDVFTSLDLDADLPGEAGGKETLSVDLTRYLVSDADAPAAQYALIRMSGGKPLSYRRAVSAEENDFLAGAIMDVLVKSAAWPGNDLSKLDEYYIVRQVFPEVPETHDYYAYLLEDGTSVMQSGSGEQGEGYYSVLSRTIYDGLKLFADAGIDRTDLDACVSDAILAQSTDHGLAGDYIAESHVTLGVTEEGARTTVYAMALDMHFSFAGGAFTGVGGGHMPVAITFTKAEDGTYTLEEYWQPMDGSYYLPSIREKFPPELAQWEMIDTQRYIQSQMQAVYAKAVAYGAVDTDAQIEALLETITSSPSLSSSSGDYIKAHPIEYRELGYYGDYTLQYVFKSFLAGGQTGLKGAVMGSIMRDLLGGENIGIAVSNEQEYFDALLAHARRIRDLNSDEFMAEHAPKCHLLLQIADASGHTDLNS